MTWQWKLWNSSFANSIYEDTAVVIWDDHLFVACVASWALSRNVQSTWDLRKTLWNMSDLCTFILSEDIIWTVLWFAEVTSVFFSHKGFRSNQFISSWTLSLPLHSSSSEKPKSAVFFFVFFPIHCTTVLSGPLGWWLRGAWLSSTGRRTISYGPGGRVGTDFFGEITTRVS